MKKKYWFVTFFMWFLICPLIFPLMSYAQTFSPRRNISLETRWGYYFFDTPKIGDETPTNGEEGVIFTRKYEIIGGLKVNFEFFRQFLQVGMGVGYMRGSEPHYFLYNIPIEASINLRFKFSPQQFIVPYVGGGADYSYFKQKGRFEPDPNSPEPGAIHINRKGYHANAGLQVLLNRLSPKASQRFDKKFGINATYLTFEARYADLTKVEDLRSLESHETDMSGWFYYMGLLFEF